MKGHRKETVIHLLSLAVIFFVLIGTLFQIQIPKTSKTAKGFTSFPTITPTPFEPFPYKIPKIPISKAYLTMLVGDSMVGSLGPNAQLLRQHLIEYYPDHEFVNYNYGFGATSIESLPERLTKETEYLGIKYPSILSQGFDLIIIESFAYNPLSQLKEGEGLNKHLKILNESIRKIIKERPESVVAVMTPIAPSKDFFAKGIYDLTPAERKQWAEERINYIEAVIDYWRSQSLPIVFTQYVWDSWLNWG